MKADEHHHTKCVRIGTTAVLFFLLTALTTNQAVAQSCNRKAQTARNTDLYDQPPQFITSRGLVYGKLVSTLRGGVGIFICEELTVGFTFSRQIWYHVAYWSNGWMYAWASANDITLAESDRMDTGWHPPAVSAATMLPRTPAFAAAPPGPALPPPGESPPPVSGSELTFRKEDKSALIDVYAWSFALLLAGMGAKIIVDLLESPGTVRLRKHLRQSLIPFLLSPMVFLGFIQSAELGIQDFKGYLVLLLFAFQNGFFWQTVINVDRTARKREQTSVPR